jgi:transcriptional regulator with XRE-family HTH domain
MTTIRAAISSKIRSERARLGISQAELGKRCGAKQTRP